MGSDDVATRPATSPSGVPASAERYVLQTKLGEGAMGVVWSARDTLLDREVALKLLHDRFLGAEYQALLAREARAMARLSHPNIVAVYDAGEQGGRAFVAMELVRGEPLSGWLATKRPWTEVLEVFRAIAGGLAAAHTAGILHRDIKPSNILIGEDGRVRIADFGVAHATATAALDPDTPLTASTAGLVGSPAYMSIERICGEAAEARGDQFSYCVAFYEALYGRRPFDASTVGGMITAIARGVPASSGDVPDWLHGVVARGLAANPADRFPSMTALATALRGPAASRRRTLLLAAGGTLVLAAIAVAGWQLASSSSNESPSGTSPASPSGSSSPGSAQIDAAVASIAPVAAADAAASPPPAPADAAPPVDAAASRIRATPPPPPRPPPAKTPQPRGQTIAEWLAMDPKDAQAMYRELLAKQKAAWGAGDFKEALRYAEEAIGYPSGAAAARKLAAIAACALGDEPYARAHLDKIPKGDGNSRIAVVQVCRRRGIELDDMLTPLERIHAQ